MTGCWVEIPFMVVVISGNILVSWLNENMAGAWEFDVAYSNGYNALIFQNAEDATAFRLRFGI